jgi:hypothetical protein
VNLIGGIRQPNLNLFNELRAEPFEIPLTIAPWRERYQGAETPEVILEAVPDSVPE